MEQEPSPSSSSSRTVIPTLGSPTTRASTTTPSVSTFPTSCQETKRHRILDHYLLGPRPPETPFLDFLLKRETSRPCTSNPNSLTKKLLNENTMMASGVITVTAVYHGDHSSLSTGIDELNLVKAPSLLFNLPNPDSATEPSGGSSVSQNKLPQLILGYIYILKYLQSNFIG